MTDVFLLSIIIVFFVTGISRPYVAFAGYIWCDIFTPQNIAFGFLNGKPLSLIFSMLCAVSFIINIKKLSKAPLTVIVLLTLFMVWFSFTTYIAIYPEVAFTKWDSSIKSVAMAVLLCFVVTKKEQLELCLIVFTLGVSYFALAAGLKTLAGGGGYGTALVTSGVNAGLAESSTLAMMSVLIVPIILYLKKHSILLFSFRRYQFFWYLWILVAVAALIGTGARTGLISIAVYGALYLIKTEQKLKVIIAIFITLFFTYTVLVTDEWTQRMDTITSAKTESSAAGRLHVWQWTWDFVKSNPNGGGFGAYRANAGHWQTYSDQVDDLGGKAKAYHSIYFEVLGEHGYVGLLLFLLILIKTWFSNKGVTKGDSDQWCKGLSTTLNYSLAVFCVGGAFIGVAFQPIVYYLVSFSILVKKISMNDKPTFEK